MVKIVDSNYWQSGNVVKFGCLSPPRLENSLLGRGPFKIT